MKPRIPLNILVASVLALVLAVNPLPAQSKLDTVVFKTSLGDLTIALFNRAAPVTVKNFLAYVDSGFYNGTIFHRVITGFMSQGGDPTGTGRGGPGYRFDNESHPNLKHNKPGVVAMANAGINTNGSQFYITHVPTPHLDGGYSIFGQLTSGLNVLLSIPERDPSRPQYPGVKVNSIAITESD